ncbi:16S rRNA (guanine(966)-N(2))-methyltransferase RsmD [Arsenophonus symbiont of Ornithomya chloropus]|uniref:16S rRNA (guanine(966)-N(2))-methyltransferase RsmD n=1 Tax=Arsenophonus symbiont of Ornithomya chloropus TaxID=634121 RepID=UPI0032B14796
MKKKHHKLKGIRIIGGKWKGRMLSVLDSQDLRPTKNKIRETLFNWLRPVIKKSHCLDCFSGSGALAIEALSHYADSVTLIELKSNIFIQLIKNLNTLEIKNAKVIKNNTIDYLSKKGKTYNIVFLDPPFYKNLLEKTVWLLEINGWLAKNSWIYIEVATKTNLNILPSNWNLYRRKQSGKVDYYLYIRN